MQLLHGVMAYADCWTDHLAVRYKPLREVKSRAGKIGTTEQLISMIRTAMANEYWQVVMWCGAVAAGTGCRGGELRKLQLKDICFSEGKIRIIREIAKSRKERQPRLMALAEWGLRQLLVRAQALGATEPDHYLLPLNVGRSRYRSKRKNGDWDVNQPMTSWVKSWRNLTEACGMKGFRLHTAAHLPNPRSRSRRALGSDDGQLGHMDRETSLEYVHIQQRALEHAKQLIESEQAEIFAATQGGLPSERLDGVGARVLNPAADHHSHIVPEPHPNPQMGKQKTMPKERLLARQFSAAINAPNPCRK